MFSKYHNRKGFILIILVFIVLIIGLNPGCTENKITQPTVVESDQSDVIGTLRLIYNMEVLYYYGKRVYLSIPNNASFSDLGMKIHDDASYNYIVELTNFGFDAIATTNLDDDETQDTWQINQFGIITNTTNDLVD